MVWLVVSWMLTFRSLYSVLFKATVRISGCRESFSCPSRRRQMMRNEGKGDGSQECVLSVSPAVAFSSHWAARTDMNHNLESFRKPNWHSCTQVYMLCINTFTQLCIALQKAYITRNMSLDEFSRMLASEAHLFQHSHMSRHYKLMGPLSGTWFAKMCLSCTWLHRLHICVSV